MTHELIKIYSTPQCSGCAATKRILQNHKVPYVVVDLEANPSRVDELSSLTNGRLVVPVITDGTETIVGWNPGLVNRMAKRHKNDEKLIKAALRAGKLEKINASGT